MWRTIKMTAETSRATNKRSSCCRCRHSATTMLLVLLLSFMMMGNVVANAAGFPRIAIGLNPTTRSGKKRGGCATKTTTHPIYSKVFEPGCTGGAATVKTMTAARMQLFNLFSGGVAGTIAACLTNPLEVVKTQLQATSADPNPVSVAQEIFRVDGVRGFFRGLPPTLVGIVPSRSAYFYAYSFCKQRLGPYLAEGSPPNALLSGLAAGICGNSLTNPIWMVRTRMQLLADSSVGQKAYAGYRDAIQTIWRQEGIAGFYKGIFASYWGCAEGALQFLVYEQIKRHLLERKSSHSQKTEEHLSKWTYFWSAAFAKGIASVATYPHEVARTRLREQARSGVFKYTGMWQTLRVIGQEEGRAGLYGGMGVHLVKVIPNSAFMFLTYEIVKAWLDQYTIVDAKHPSIRNKKKHGR